MRAPNTGQVENLKPAFRPREKFPAAMFIGQFVALTPNPAQLTIIAQLSLGRIVYHMNIQKRVVPVSIQRDIAIKSVR
jgi:hypothetical protein